MLHSILCKTSEQAVCNIVDDIGERASLVRLTQRKMSSAPSECSGEFEPCEPKKNAGKCVSATILSTVMFAPGVTSP